MLRVEFPQVQKIDTSKIIVFWKLSNASTYLRTIFVVSHFLIAEMSPEWRLNPVFGTQKKRPFPLNRGVPSMEVTNTNIM